jgi:hypothetical protein
LFEFAYMFVALNARVCMCVALQAAACCTAVARREEVPTLSVARCCSKGGTRTPTHAHTRIHPHNTCRTTWNSLIWGFAHSLDTRKAEVAMRQARLQGCPPDAQTWSSLLHVCVVRKECMYGWVCWCVIVCQCQRASVSDSVSVTVCLRVCMCLSALGKAKPPAMLARHSLPITKGSADVQFVVVPMILA